MSIEDQAQEHEAHIWAINNRPRQVERFQPGDSGYGPEECDDCGAEMHPVRRSHGFNRCTACQSAIERRLGR